MAIVTTDNQHYTDIAAAIRSKNGTETLYKPSEMAAAIQAISGGGGEPPDDGKTRLYITVPANAMPDRPPPRNQVPLYIQQTVANGVTIDWGDGTAPETLPGTGAVNTTHTYEQAGDYVISLDPAEGCELHLGYSASNYCVMGYYTSVKKPYNAILKKAYIGNRVPNIIYSFSNCVGLQSISILSEDTTRIGIYAFYHCVSLNKIKFGENITLIDNSAFEGCESLETIVFPEMVTKIGSNSFSQCKQINSFMIQHNVNTIKNSAFSYCYNVKEYHFLSPTPPTLSGTDVFTSIPSDCIIYVPKGSAEAYKTATNWTTYAQYIQEEPA